MKYLKYSLALICSFVISDNIVEIVTNRDFRFISLMFSIIIVSINAIIIYWLAEFIYKTLNNIFNEQSDTHSDGESKDW